MKRDENASAPGQPNAHLVARYKLRFQENRVRAVPFASVSGRPFEGPGVDLQGDEARAVLELAAPLLAWLDAREPGISRTIRSLSATRAEDGEPLKVLVTFDDTGSEPLSPTATGQRARAGSLARPRVVRVDPPHVADLVACGRAMEKALAAACTIALERRASVHAAHAAARLAPRRHR